MTKTDYALDAPIPMDPNLKYGTLDNGLRYYVLPNQFPKGRIHMQLLVHVGSIFEDEDQRGLAHITEHMAFNGSTHFSGSELISFLESLGMRYGAHINAMTSADFTLYKLEVPTTDADTTHRALKVLRDWASELLFLPDEIERERKVALEEWRMYRMSQQRVMEQIRPHFFANTPYADRLPIGTEHSLRTFTHDALRRFYEDWYRPELMSVLIVGDMDATDMVEQISKLFSDMRARQSSRPLPDMSWSRPEQLEFTSAYDSELPHPMISILSPVPAENNHTHQGYINLMMRSIIARVCSERFLLQSVKPDAPFYQAGASYSRIHPRYMVDSINALVSHDRFQEGCIAMVQEINRLRHYGVTREELERHIRKIITDLESGYLERDSIHSTQLLNELLSFAKDGEPITGIEYELQMATALLPTITVEDIQQELLSWLPEVGSLCYAVANDQEAVGSEALEAYYHHAMTLPVSPPEAQTSDIQLMANVPSVGEIRSKCFDEKYGVHQFQLSNGALVWVYPTSHEADSIHFQSYSWGGTSLLADQDVKPALFVPYFVELSGLGEHDYASMMRLTSTLQTRVEPFCDQNRHGFVGGCVLKDTEAMFQLLYLQVMKPRFEEAAFERNIAVNKELLENREKNPEYLFSKEINRHSWAHTTRRGFLSFADFDNATLAQGKTIYNDLWGHAQQLYCFVGNIDVSSIEQHIAQYIATLPSIQSTEVRVHPNERLFEGHFMRSFSWLNEPKAVVKSRRYVLSDVFDPSKSLPLRLFSMVAEQRLRKKLRDELGQVYTVGVHATQQRHPISFNLRYEFGCDPELVAEVTEQTERVLLGFIEKPIQADEFKLAKSQLMRSLEVQAQSNPVWLRRLVASHQNTGGINWAFQGRLRIENETIRNVMTLIQPILNSPHHITMQLGPKAVPSASEV
ncbi:MAG: insulinase family protein [Myxococcota bacterium]|nr:insulinase family protein [Myxococcota bacterium]